MKHFIFLAVLLLPSCSGHAPENIEKTQAECVKQAIGSIADFNTRISGSCAYEKEATRSMKVTALEVSPANFKGEGIPVFAKMVANEHGLVYWVWEETLMDFMARTNCTVYINGRGQQWFAGEAGTCPKKGESK